MKDITLGNRSEATGRFNFVLGATGDVSFDDTETHAVMTAAMERRGGYWANPNHGSLVFQLKSLTTSTPSQAQAMVLDALQFLERNGRITNVSVVSLVGKTSTGGGSLGLLIKWTTPDGKPGSATL